MLALEFGKQTGGAHHASCSSTGGCCDCYEVKLEVALTNKKG